MSTWAPHSLYMAPCAVCGRGLDHGKILHSGSQPGVPVEAQRGVPENLPGDWAEDQSQQEQWYRDAHHKLTSADKVHAMGLFSPSPPPVPHVQPANEALLDDRRSSGVGPWSSPSPEPGLTVDRGARPLTAKRPGVHVVSASLRACCAVHLQRLMADASRVKQHADASGRVSSAFGHRDDTQQTLHTQGRLTGLHVLSQQVDLLPPRGLQPSPPSVPQTLPPSPPAVPRTRRTRGGAVRKSRREEGVHVQVLAESNNTNVNNTTSRVRNLQTAPSLEWAAGGGAVQFYVKLPVEQVEPKDDVDAKEPPIHAIKLKAVGHRELETGDSEAQCLEILQPSGAPPGSGDGPTTCRSAATLARKERLKALLAQEAPELVPLLLRRFSDEADAIPDQPLRDSQGVFASSEGVGGRPTARPPMSVPVRTPRTSMVAERSRQRQRLVLRREKLDRPSQAVVTSAHYHAVSPFYGQQALCPAPPTPGQVTQKLPHPRRQSHNGAEMMARATEIRLGRAVGRRKRSASIVMVHREDPAIQRLLTRCSHRSHDELLQPEAASKFEVGLLTARPL